MFSEYSVEPSGSSEENSTVETINTALIVQETCFGPQEETPVDSGAGGVAKRDDPLSISKYFRSDEDDDVFDRIISKDNTSQIHNSMMQSVLINNPDETNISTETSTDPTTADDDNKLQIVEEETQYVDQDLKSEIRTTDLSVSFRKDDSLELADAALPEFVEKSESSGPVICKIFSQDEDSEDNSFFDSLDHSQLLQQPPPLMSTPASKAVPEFTPTQMGMACLDSLRQSPYMHSPSEDLFTQSLQLNEKDRSSNAWIPSPKTQQSLISVVTSAPGTYFPEREMLTMPGVILEEDMVDAVRELVLHLSGDQEASERKVLTCDSVTQDDRGVRELMKCGCYRAAVNLTGRLLSVYGQGAGKAGHHSKHTPHSLQLWFTRLSLLIKLHQFSIAAVEAEAFGDLDRPDMYFEYYPDLYGSRKGSMASFSFRLLLAEIPQYTGKHKVALTALYYLLRVTRKIQHNLSNGFAEDGSSLELNDQEREESKTIWRKRELRVMYSIANCTLHMKDYTLTISMLESILTKDEQNQVHVYSAMGRLFLQQGDIENAQTNFTKAQTLRSNTIQEKVATLVDSALITVAQNAFAEAYDLFKAALDLQKNNLMLVNNMAVCLLYNGNLEGALKLLEDYIKANPHNSLHEQALINVCTLYELESSCSNQKKLGMLSLVNKYQGDGININCLKLQMQ